MKITGNIPDNFNISTANYNKLPFPISESNLLQLNIIPARFRSFHDNVPQINKMLCISKEKASKYDRNSLILTMQFQRD